MGKTLVASLTHLRIDNTNSLIHGSTKTRYCSLYKTQLPWGAWYWGTHTLYIHTDQLAIFYYWSITLASCSVRNILQDSLSHLQDTFTG